MENIERINRKRIKKMDTYIKRSKTRTRRQVFGDESCDDESEKPD